MGDLFNGWPEDGEPVTTLSDEEMVAWANANIDRVAELEAKVQVLEEIRQAHVDELLELKTENKRLRAALHRIALYKNHEPAKDFTHCVQIARYALYPEGVKFRSKEFYELAELVLREDG